MGYVRIVNLYNIFYLKDVFLLGPRNLLASYCTKTNQQVQFQANFFSHPNLLNFENPWFFKFQSKIKAECRPAELTLAVKIVGLVVENLCVQSCPEEGPRFGVEVSNNGLIL